MAVALRLYEQLTEAPDDKTRARVIAEALEEMEQRYPQIRDMATQETLRVTELRLVKEIEQIRQEIREIESRLSLEIKEVELRMIKEIELVRQEIREIELRMAREIELVRQEIREVESRLYLEMKEIDSRLSLKIKEVERKLSLDIKGLEVKIADSRAELIRWVVGAGVLQSTLIIAILLKVAHLI